jgi:hypothetical protein
MPRFQPEKIFAVLLRHQVEFITIGGIAATLHGSNLRTGDLDICPRRDPENLNRLARALRELQARIRTEGAPEGLPVPISPELLEKAILFNFTTRWGDFDLSFEPTGTRGFEELAKEAVDFDLEGQVIPVASLKDVIRSKEAANRQKDRDQLPTLRALLQEIEQQT